MNNPEAPKMVGVIGFFDHQDPLIEATKKVRDANYESFDTYTPYAVHGLEHAQGLKRSPLPYVTLFAGLTGFATAWSLQYWTSAVDWAINVGGKPYNSWPASVPIYFELTVLFAALSTVGAMFALNGLPNTSKKAFDPSITRDRFAIVIEAPNVDEHDEEGDHPHPKKTGFKEFSESEAKSFLQSLGAKDVRVVYAEGWFG